MTKFDLVRIGDLGDVVTGKTPRTEDEDNYGGDYMFIGPTDLHKHFFIEKSEKYISNKGFESIKGSALAGTSVLVGCIGWDMGNVGIVRNKCATNQQINAITNFRAAYNPLYIYYHLKNKKDFLFQQAGVTRTPILNKTTFSNIRISVPTCRVKQDSVAAVLSSIDQKIEINNRINAGLEAMAKTLYDYWFVQFDFPDENGKPYKSSGGKMLYSKELKREIPAGWEAKHLIDVFPISNASLTPSSDFDKIYRYYSIPYFDSFAGYEVENGGNIGSNKFTVSKENILVSKLNPWFNRVVFSSGEEDVICSTEFVVLVAENNEMKSYLYLMVKSQEFITYCINSASGTSNSHKRVNPSVMGRYSFPYNKIILNAFGEKVYPIIQKMESNKKENQRLAALRDWLLPMLMNGQVRVESAADDLYSPEQDAGTRQP